MLSEQRERNPDAKLSGSSFKNYLEAQGKSRSTVSHYNSYVLDFLGWLDQDNTEVDNATAKEVLGYLDHLKRKGQENKTRNIRLNVIRHFFNYRIDHGHRSDNPLTHMKIRGSNTRKLHPILSRQELEQIYNNYEVPSEEDDRSNRNWFKAYRLSKARNKAVLSLMIHQGLSTPEVNRLQLNDLKLKEGKLYIAGSRKSNERELELRSDQIMELMEYQYTTRAELLNYQLEETKQLFLSTPTAGKQQANTTLQIWKGLTKEVKAKNPKLTNFKQVRASVITHWLKIHNLREVQYMAGHRFVSSTERYLINQTEDLQKDVDRFHPLG